jgi:DNA-binding NtrC family response regulator
MPTLWIVHREPRLRAAIARLATAGEDAVLGAPSDPTFDSAPAPEVVLLGLADDFEAELQFAHRLAARLRDAAWILLPERDRRDEARQLFDTVAAEILSYPPDAHALREQIQSASRRRAPIPLPLSQRPARDALGARFARWFADLDLPELLRALDPRLADVPLLILGEPGTGRGLLARYVHAFSGTAGGTLAEVVCAPSTSGGEVLAAIGAATRAARPGSAVSIWLADVDRLAPALQRQLHAWIELAPPAGALCTDLVRWIGTARDEARLEPGLRQSLEALSIRIPPLRERPYVVEPFAKATLLAWCRARREHPRGLDPSAVAALEEYPWPGNLSELEAVITQTLCSTSAEPLRVGDLRYQGAAFAPLEADQLGPVIAEEEAAAPIARIAPAPPVEETQPTPSPEAETAEVTPGSDPDLRRFAGAVAHEVRNPLSSIRTFAELLPQQYRDSEFRTRFAEIVSQDVLRIEEVVERLNRLAQLEPPRREAVDIAALLATLLEERRDAIHQRRLLVLRELDAQQPLATGDGEQLRFAFEALLNKSLELVPERGNIYIASKHHGSGLRGRPSVRVLVRFHGPERDGPAVLVPEASPAENALEFAIAEAIARAHGGVLAIDSGDGDETVIVLDLPAPA